MSDPQGGPDTDHWGSVDYLAAEFPTSRITGDGFAVLLELVDRASGRVLDLEFVARNLDGTFAVVDIGSLAAAPRVDLTTFTGACAGVLDQSDFDEVDAVIAAGSIAALLVYEELSTLPVIAAWERGGGHIVAEDQVSSEQILPTLDTTEPA